MKMKFCETCGNVLLPKRNKKTLYCKVCDKELTAANSKHDLEEYKRRLPNKKKTDTKKALKTAIVADGDENKIISEEERDAYEDLFMLGEDFGSEE
jgi:DNA-directed RNA polymerase subunit M/transcription elongation factor TFIIS